MATKAPSKKEKWSPGCCTNADVVSCELRGNGNWSRYHAILRDGREIELRRVSNVLDMMETKALVQWSANETSAQIWSQLLYLMPPEIVEAAGLVPAKEFDPNITGDLKTLLRVRERDGVLSTEAQVTFVKLIYKLCHEARLMSNRTKNTAAEWGTQAHSWIERFLKYNYWPDENEQADIPEPVYNSLRLFAEWWQGAGLEVVHGGVEVYVWDLDLGVGGTVDLLAKRKDGTLWLFDWKTGTGLYSKAILQMAAYFGCLTKAGHKLSGAVLANIGRDHGIPQFRELTPETLRPAWNYFRDLAMSYETASELSKLCENWNKEHKEANVRRREANTAAAEGEAGSHLDSKELWRELSASVKKLDKRLHSVLTDTKIGEVDGTGCELLLPLGFGWNMDELGKALPTLQQIAERKSGIAGFQVRLRYDGQ